MTIKKLRMMVIGGSNSVMIPGYVSTLTEILTDVHGIPVDLVNPSAGYNTSVFGLLTLKLGRAVEDSDLFVIEYSINDYLLCVDDNWAIYFAAVEGMVREILRRNATAKIALLLFGRRNENPEIAERMFDFNRRIAEHYKVCVVPVDEYLRKKLKKEEVQDAYSDDAHYRRHQVSTFVGSLVANHIVALLRSDVLPGYPDDLVSEPSLEHSRALLASDFTTKGHTAFSNSRYNEHAVKIDAGETLEVEAPGALVLFKYISCPLSCRANISDDLGNSLTHETLNKDVVDGRFQFLVRSILFDPRNWPTASPSKPRRLRFSALPRQNDFRLDIKGGDMIAPSSDQGLGFFLSALLVY